MAMKSILDCIVYAVEQEMEKKAIKAANEGTYYTSLEAESVRLADGKFLNVHIHLNSDIWTVTASVFAYGGIATTNTAVCTTRHHETGKPVIKWGPVKEVIRDTLGGYIH